MKLLIAYLVGVAISATILIYRMPNKVSLLKLMLVAALYPLQIFLFILAEVYRLFGVGLFLECSILMTEEEYQDLSDREDENNENDT